MQFSTLLDYLKVRHGFDFTGYNRSGLMQRMKKRMQQVGIEDYGDYQNYLEVHPEEFTHLFNTLLSKITTFFSEPAAWDYLATEIIPRMIASIEPNQPIRVWSAGCGRGQETYTLAIVLAQAMGIEQFKQRVKIYATDIDVEALNYARGASYSAREVVIVPHFLRDQYFERSVQRYVVRQDLRSAVIFYRHDLMVEPPLFNINLLVCRNVLMYFNAQTQNRILESFYLALNNSGFLFLGTLDYIKRFMPLNLKRSVFIKVPPVNRRNSELLSFENGFQQAISPLIQPEHLEKADSGTYQLAQLILDLNGCLTLVNEYARALFDLNSGDLGRPWRELELFDSLPALRLCIEKACAEHCPMRLNEVIWRTHEGNVRYLEVQVLPLLDTSGSLFGFCVTLCDVTGYKQLQSQFEYSKQDLETTSEELETTNEELKTTNEDLEVTHWELQATVKELNTINEELLFSNLELQTLNNELRQSRDELNSVNAFMESILISLPVGVVVLDTSLHVQVWNQKAEELWERRANEVRGRHFSSLNISLPVKQLQQPIQASLDGLAEQCLVTLDTVNNRDKTNQYQVTCKPLLGSSKKIQGVILLIEPIC